MKKFSFGILLFFIFYLLLIPLPSYSSGKVKNIVIFFSLNAAVPAYQNFLEGFRYSLSEKTDEPYNLLIEYLDVGRFPEDDYAKQIVSVYNEQFRETSIDLVITVAPGTWQILNRLGLKALRTSKVIEVEFNNTSGNPEIIRPDKNTVELKVKLDVAITLQNAFNLFFRTKNVFVFGGNTSTDDYLTNSVRLGAREFEKSYKFNYFTHLSIDSILHIAREIPANSIVVVPSFMQDTRNIPMSSTLFVSTLANQCSAPIFTVSDNFVKRGGIGGYVYSYYNLGKEAKRISLELFKGTSPKDIVVNHNMYQYMYNWDQLKRWNLQDSKLIPSNSIFYNKETDFITEYRWRILFVILFVSLETILIVYLVRVNRRQKEFMVQKAETENLYRELVREERLMRMAELTASLSHELNQPLTAILYNAQAGNRFLDSGKLDANQAKEIFDNIVEDGKRAGGIISSVKSMMKSETREKETFSIQDAIQDSINIYTTEALQQNIQIRYSQPGNPVMVLGDKTELQQVLLNLFSNATKAMQNTATEYKIIEIKQEIGRNSVTVSVRDNGTGISDAIKDKLFKPFITTHKSGLGIGLSISRSIIERHGGVITAENKEGGGAEFSFTLKLAENE